MTDTGARQLHVAEVALRTFARSATGPGDRPQSLAILLAEYDRRAELLDQVRAAVRTAFGPHAGPTTYDDAEDELFALLDLDRSEVMGHGDDR